MKHVVILLAALVLVLGANLATGVPYPPAETQLIGALDINGERLTLDADGDSYIVEAADDRIDLYLGDTLKIRADSSFIIVKTRIYNSDGPLNLGDLGSTSHAYGAGATLIGDELEVNGVVSLDGIQADLGATCTTGQLAFDTGGATQELCYCQTTNTWMCAAFAAGPVD